MQGSYQRRLDTRGGVVSHAVGPLAASANSTRRRPGR